MKRTDHIDELEFSVRTRNCLIRRGITTVGELVDTDSDDILRIRGLGGKGLREILEKIKKVMPELAPPGGYIERHRVLSVARQNGASEAFIEELDKIPEADAEPVRRSNWTRLQDNRWLCKACGHVIKVNDVWEHPLKDLGIKYCEACGAKMTKREHANNNVGGTVQGR